MSLVGIIANPASGQDIRRVVSDAIIINNHQKVNIVRRLLAALTWSKVDRVEIMPDLFGIGERAIALTDEPHPATSIEIIDLPVEGTQEDTLCAARHLREAGAACIVTLGGDGTCRMVAKACGEVPLLPISTGTNNVVPVFVEGTVAGLAAAYLAQHPTLQQADIAARHKKLVVSVNDQPVDEALIDVALIETGLVGAKAVWEGDAIRQVVVTRASPTYIGLSAIVGMVQPIAADVPLGAAAMLGSPGKSIHAAIAPGRITQLELKQMDPIHPGIAFALSGERPAVLALDGEREVVLLPGDRAHVTLELGGPWIVNIERVLHLAIEEHTFNHSRLLAR